MAVVRGETKADVLPTRRAVAMAESFMLISKSDGCVGDGYGGDRRRSTDIYGVLFRFIVSD